MELDADRGLLFIADSGNRRIATLDIELGTQGSGIFPNYDGTSQYYMNDAVIESFVDEDSSVELVAPSGLALHGNMVFVSDNSTSKIYAFDIDSAELIDWIDLSSVVPTGGLMGLAFDAKGNLFVTDEVNSTVLKLEA